MLSASSGFNWTGEMGEGADMLLLRILPMVLFLKCESWEPCLVFLLLL
jgi:hypothetical protein